MRDIDIYFYMNSHLPEDGWLQACFICGIISSNSYLEEIIKTKYCKYYINCCLCTVCDEKIDTSNRFQRFFSEKYKKHLNKWCYYKGIVLRKNTSNR